MYMDQIKCECVNPKTTNALVGATSPTFEDQSKYREENVDFIKTYMDRIICVNPDTSTTYEPIVQDFENSEIFKLKKELDDSKELLRNYKEFVDRLKIKIANVKTDKSKKVQPGKFKEQGKKIQDQQNVFADQRTFIEKFENKRGSVSQIGKFSLKSGMKSSKRSCAKEESQQPKSQTGNISSEIILESSVKNSTYLDSVPSFRQKELNEILELEGVRHLSGIATKEISLNDSLIEAREISNDTHAHFNPEKREIS